MNANASQLQFRQSLIQHGLLGSPADRIVNRPGKEVWRHAGNDNPMFERLAKNFHWFGRNGNPVWQWGPASGGNATGKELVAGQVMQTNCGGFNLSVRWIAEHICNICNATGSFTLANEYFITRANCTVLDRGWQGSVRTLTQDFAQLKAFFFMGHSWSQLNGQMYDATTKVMGFHNKTDLYWCGLDRTQKTITGQAGGRVFMVQRIHHPPAAPIPGNGPYICISNSALRTHQHLFPIVWQGPGPIGVTQSFINAFPATAGAANWETFLLVSREHVPQTFRQAVGPL